MPSPPEINAPAFPLFQLSQFHAWQGNRQTSVIHDAPRRKRRVFGIQLGTTRGSAVVYVVVFTNNGHRSECESGEKQSESVRSRSHTHSVYYPLFALQDFRRITPCCLHRMRSDHQKCDQQYRQQTNEQFCDMYGCMIWKMSKDNVFEEQISCWQGNEGRYRQEH